MEITSRDTAPGHQRDRFRRTVEGRAGTPRPAALMDQLPARVDLRAAIVGRNSGQRPERSSPGWAASLHKLHGCDGTGSPSLAELKTSLVEGAPFAFLFLDRRRAASANAAGAAGDCDAAGPQLAIAVGYDDGEHAFIVIDQEAPGEWDRQACSYLSYAYVTDPLLSQEVCVLRGPTR